MYVCALGFVDSIAELFWLGPDSVNNQQYDTLWQNLDISQSGNYTQMNIAALANYWDFRFQFPVSAGGTHTMDSMCYVCACIKDECLLFMYKMREGARKRWRENREREREKHRDRER